MTGKQLIGAFMCLAMLSTSIAAPAPWYIWRSKLTGKTTCQQTMQGEWEKVSGPYKDARCEKPGTP